MPKQKTSRAAAKRFKLTGTGKLKRNKAYKRHILTKKTTKTKRNLRKPAMTDATNVKNMKKILHYFLLIQLYMLNLIYQFFLRNIDILMLFLLLDLF